MTNVVKTNPQKGSYPSSTFRAPDDHFGWNGSTKTIHQKLISSLHHIHPSLLKVQLISRWRKTSKAVAIHLRLSIYRDQLNGRRCCGDLDRCYVTSVILCHCVRCLTFVIFFFLKFYFCVQFHQAPDWLRCFSCPPLISPHIIDR